MAFGTLGGGSLPKKKPPVKFPPPPPVRPPYHPPPPSGAPPGPPPFNFGGPPPVNDATAPTWQPDYQSLIENDPTFNLLKQQLAAQGIEDKAGRDAAIRRAYVMFGGHPTGLGALSGLIDPTTQSLADDATKSGLSTTARMGMQHDTAVAQIRNSLASRGLAHSGETGTQFNREQGDYTRANYDATQKLVDYFGGVQAAYVAGERDRQARLLAGMQSAASAQASYPWNQPHDATATVPGAPPPPAVGVPAPVPGGSPRTQALVPGKKRLKGVIPHGI